MSIFSVGVEYVKGSWMLLGVLLQLAAAFRQHSLEVYEWDRVDVEKSRLPNGPSWAALTQPRAPLTFSGWDLAHAAVRMDYLVKRNYLLPGFGFLLGMDQLVDFSAGTNLRLVDGAPATLNDFTGRSLSGRLGQGLSLLFAHDQGYSFAGHLASDPLVQSHVATLPGKKRKVADFLFETVASDRMILESKASFMQPHNDPSRIKSVLRPALREQVDYWLARIMPAASKGFAVYSCLREAANPTPSALIFVDPPSRIGPRTMDLPDTWVRRQNYAACLDAMGLFFHAQGLRSGIPAERPSIELPVVRIADRDFAVAFSFPGVVGTKIPCAGLEVHVLEAVLKTLDGNETALLAAEANAGDLPSRALRTEESWSIFPDGSFLGMIERKRHSFKYLLA